jgi:hypothetical protein
MTNFLKNKCLNKWIRFFMVNNLRMVVVSKHCSCAMFVFQSCSLHISKDVSYDFNNFVSNSLYQNRTTSL